LIRKIIIFSGGLVLLLSSTAPARSAKYTISGMIHFEKAGTIYAKVVTRKQYRNNTSSPFRLKIPVDAAAEKAKTVPFAFREVPEGTYGIMVFEDINGNGKFDMGMFGPKEPWGMYRPVRPMFRRPRFSEMAFSLKKNLTHVVIDLK
jgi:uncharacterized protein (DUF2141 family)